MKKILAILMGLVSIVVLGSCSGDDFIMDMPPVDNTPKDTTTTTPDPNKNDEWETTRDDWFDMMNNIINSHKETNLANYEVNVPFSASLGNDMYLSFDKKNNVEFKSLENIAAVTPSYGEWYANSENDSIRTITTSQRFDTNIYNRSLTVTTGEAYRLLNGKRESFLMPTLVNTSYGVSLDDSIRVERNDSIIDKFTFTDYVVINFVDKGAIRNDLQPVKVTAKTVIEIFIGMKENNENMPEPTYWVEGEILWISSRTASPIYKNYSKKDQGADWYGVDVIKTTKKTYTVANGVMKDVYDNSELADATWNSCVYDAGYTNKWVPCIITPNDGGWSYTLQFADGTARVMDVAGGQALIDGLKSFQKDHNAAQTPFLDRAAAVKKPYTNGVLWTVNANGVYSYTVAGK